MCGGGVYEVEKLERAEAVEDFEAGEYNLGACKQRSCGRAGSQCSSSYQADNWAFGAVFAVGRCGLGRDMLVRAD